MIKNNDHNCECSICAERYVQLHSSNVDATPDYEAAAIALGFHRTKSGKWWAPNPFWHPSFMCHWDTAEAIFASWGPATSAQPQSPPIQEVRQTVEDAIRTFCQSLGVGAVSISSDGVERIYYVGINLNALSVAVTLALPRPK